MVDTAETELPKPKLELYEMDITPVNENTATFAWIHHHPGAKTVHFETVNGEKFDYYYRPRSTTPRYASVTGNFDHLPSHIIPVMDQKLNKLVIAKAPTKRNDIGWTQFGDNPSEAHFSGVDHHPYIADVYNLAVDDKDGIYMIMEYLPHGTLQEWLKQPHSAQEIGSVVDKISQAVHHVNTKRHLIYADLKPLNVGFDEQDNPKLLDFELAAIIRDDGTGFCQHATREYEAPEQDKQQPITVRTDVYRLAATVFSILIGDVDFMDVKHLRDQFVSDPDSLIPLRTEYQHMFSDDQHRQLSDLLRQGLHKDPQHRQVSIPEFNQPFQSIILANRKSP